MSIKDILVQVDAGAASPGRLDLAIGLARGHGAHLIGLCVFDIHRIPGAGFGTINSENSMALSEYQVRVRDDALQVAHTLETSFRERLRRDGLEGEWRLVEGRAAATVGLHARYADLAVLGQEDPDDRRSSGWTSVLEQALFSSGRPILVVPYAGHFTQVGRRVLIGWNARREAARAVHDALPLIAGADDVTVLAIDPQRGLGGHGEDPAVDIAQHLARHGLRVTAAQMTSGGLEASDVLLNHAADLGADLIVVGGYGHPRAWEMVLGGVTRALLQCMTVPVLMSIKSGSQRQDVDRE